MIMVPLDLVSSAELAGPGAAGGGDEQDVPQGEDIVVVASPQRQAIAGAMQSLMGDDMDADGVSADLIDAGGELVLWGVPPSPDAIAVMPDLDDWSDPDAWLDALDEMDLAPGVEAEIERLARAASEASGDGEGRARAEFARRISDVLRQAGVEVIAIRNQRGGFDWMTLSQEDLARERDGEPWAPPGGFSDGLTPRPVGVSLGLGGRVSVWPAPAADDPAAGRNDPGGDDEPPERLRRERDRMADIAKN